MALATAHWPRKRALLALMGIFIVGNLLKTDIHVFDGAESIERGVGAVHPSLVEEFAGFDIALPDEGLFAQQTLSLHAEQIVAALRQHRCNGGVGFGQTAAMENDMPHFVLPEEAILHRIGQLGYILLHSEAEIHDMVAERAVGLIMQKVLFKIIVTGVSHEVGDALALGIQHVGIEENAR